MEARAARHWLWLIAAALSLQPLATDLYLPSLPHLMTVFDVPAAAVQRTLTIFVTGFGFAQLFAGALSDRYGRRPIALAGSLFFVAASAICAFATVLDVLVAGRLLQALGCCAVVVAARAAVRDRHSPAEGARFFARASTLLALVPLLGPIVGGYTQTWFGWRAAFVLHVALGSGLWLAWQRGFAESLAQPDPAALAPRRLLAAYRTVALHPGFRAYALPAALTYGAIFVFIAGSSFAFIEVLGVPASRYGLCFAFGVSGYLLGTLVCRRLLRRLALDRVLLVGLSLTALGGGGLWLGVRYGAPGIPLLLGAQFIVMLAHGLNQPCAQSGALGPFGAQAGTAAGLLGFISMVVAFTVGSLLGWLHAPSLQPIAMVAGGIGICAVLSGMNVARARAELTS